MSTCLVSQVQAGSRQGGAVLGKHDPEVPSPPPAQVGEDMNCHRRRG